MPTAVIYDCEGARLSADERAFFRDADPLGFILFADHCSTPDDVRAHVDELREAVGRDDVLFLIDQEGGRVVRMKPPAFPAHPPAARFGELYRLDPAKAREAARLNGFLLGRMTASLGVNVNCVPMLDIPQIDTDPVVIGDRAIAAHPDIVADLAGAMAAGLIDGGALPVIKHLPGHGRALVDSHKDLPRIGASIGDLRATDFAPFKALNGALMGMTGHIVFDAIDADLCATMSETVITEIIRGDIGFDGLLFSDDLRMGALDGDIVARVHDSLAAGCDIALCCNFTMEEKRAAACAAPVLSGDALRRVDAVFDALPIPPAHDPAALSADYDRLNALLRPVLLV